MATNFNSLKVNDGVGKKNGFDLSSDHLTTLQFGEIVPLNAIDCIAGDNFNVKYGIFSRCAPMVLPTYGDVELRTMDVFVPYFQVAEDFEAFLLGKTAWKGSPVRMRTITLSNIVNFLIKTENSVTVTGDAKFDFSYLNTQLVEIKKKFTPRGKYIYKVLRSLGYQIPKGVMQDDAKQLNALPLLCFFKAYNDYMAQSALFDSSVLTQLLEQIKDGIVTEIRISDLQTFFDYIHLMYQQDYFTTAWKTPTSPVGDAIALNMAGSTSVYGISVDLAYDGSTPKLNAYTEGNVTSIGQNDLDVLKSFDIWTRRNAYSGSRTLEQIYSRFGIKVKDIDVEYCDLLNSSSQRLSVGDVTSTASGDNNVLGDYAGKGIVNGASGYNFKATDFGMLLTIGYITVKPIYADGFERSVLKTRPLDFYQPEYDGIGINPISKGEVSAKVGGEQYKDVFGYTERYNEYRCAKSKVTGDMSLSRYIDADKWHFNRNLDDIIDDGELYAQSASFMNFDGNQYDKIFSITDMEEDKFYLTCSFDVKAIRPIKSVDAVTGLGEGSTTIHRNGNIVQ